MVIVREMIVIILIAGVFHFVSASKPNIVFIMSDDQGFNTVGFRDSEVVTPNIDAMAKKGVILDTHYVMPQCSPTRATLLTGRYPIRTGFWYKNLHPGKRFGIPLNEVTMANMLQKNGYRTHAVGKWHCGFFTYDYTPVKRGFDTFLGQYIGQLDHFQYTSKNAIDIRYNYLDDNNEVVDEILYDAQGTYSTDLYTGQAVKIIKEHDSDKAPLFLYLAYSAPHYPLQVPKDYFNEFIPKNDTNFIRRKRYRAMVSAMDQGIGQVVQALEDNKMMENTVLVFISDNGALSNANNAPFRGQKKSFFEGGVRSIAVVSSPLMEMTDYTNYHLHHVVDWYATFKYLAGDTSQPTNTLDGVNIWDSISKNISVRNEVLINMRDPEKFFANVSYLFALRQDKWKLIDGRPEGKTNGTWLFDISTDVTEEHNLAKQHPDIVKRMRERSAFYKDGVVKIEKTKKFKPFTNKVFMPQE